MQLLFKHEAEKWIQDHQWMTLQAGQSEPDAPDQSPVATTPTQ